MIERPTTWAEVDVGVTLLSPTGLPMLVTKKWPSGGIAMENRHRREFLVAPKPATMPVTLLEMSEEEALAELKMQLGAYRYLDFETERRAEARARQRIVPALSHGDGRKQAKAMVAARDHVDWYHGTYSGKAEYAGGFTKLADILAAHEEMHAQTFFDVAHTHRKGTA